MRTISILLFIFLSTTLYASPKWNLTPQPHHIHQLSTNPVKTFNYQGNYSIHLKGEIATDHLQKLYLLFPHKEKRAKQKVVIGYTSERTFRKQSKEIPQISGAYRITITANKIEIIGHDDRALHYALQTLDQLVDQNATNIDIIDYPDIKHRGIVEGFYGTPWSFNDRKRQLEFYGQNRLNTYIYGPKDDPYHSSPNWRKPYPTKAAKEIERLATTAKENRVDFIWAIHPGKDIQWNNEDRQALIDKFEQMYQLGVRGYAVFFDDISGIGTDPKNQASLLNYIIDHFYKKHHDLIPLIMCPTDYTKQWANPSPDGYLATLGKLLYPEVAIMWTGDNVVGDITNASLQWVNSRIKRSAYVWWNYPVSDYCTHNLLLGPCYGLENKEPKSMGGFVSNPMEFSEASMISLFSVAKYCWNIEAFDAIKSWNQAIDTLIPEAPKAYKFFADFNIDANSSWGWKTGKEASNFKRLASNEDHKKLDLLFKQIVESANKIEYSVSNQSLLDEILPWIQQFRWMGLWGTSLNEIDQSIKNENTAKAWNQMLTAQKYQEKVIQINQQYNKGRGVEVGGSSLLPYLKKQTTKLETKLLNQLSKEPIKAPTLFGYCPISEGSENLFDADINTSYIFNKKISKGDYIGIDLQKEMEITSIDIYQSSGRDHITKGIIEFSLDKQKWQPLSDKVFTKSLVQYEGKPQKARYIRYKALEESKSTSIKVYDIFINKKEPFAFLIYSSRPFRNLPYKYNAQSINFNKKLEITNMAAHENMSITFLRPERIEQIKLNLDTQYKNLSLYYIDNKGKKRELKEGVINGVHRPKHPIKQITIENQSTQSQAIRLLELKIIFQEPITDMKSKYQDLDLQSFYTLTEQEEITITNKTNCRYLLFKGKDLKVALTIETKDGQKITSITKNHLYMMPPFKQIQSIKIKNLSKYTSDIVEIIQ